MAQQGQVVQMKSKRPAESRFGDTGIGLAGAARGGCSGAASQSERDAGEALERALERLRRANGTGEHADARRARRGVPRPARRATGDDREAALAARESRREFGDRRLGELRSQEIAAWRMTIAAGHRFEATQALRQVLARAVVWGMIDVNPAKQGVDNPQRRRTEKRPFESWAQLAEVAARLGTAQRAARDVRGGDRSTARRVDRARAARHRPGRTCRLRPSRVPQRPAQVHQDRGQRPRRAAAGGRARRRSSSCPTRADTDLLFPSLRGAYFDLHNFRTREWKPAQLAAGITPIRRVYDLRHTFATFALRAGISTFDLSRYMGASLTMIDRHYGHLARDGRDHAINLLDNYSRALTKPTSTSVDVAWTLQQRAVATAANEERL